MRFLPLSFLLIVAIFSSGYRFRCFLFCTEQTGTQNDYAESRDECEDYAGAKIDEAMKGEANPDSEKTKQAKMVALLSECMAKKGWDVPSGNKPKEKTVAGNTPKGESLLPLAGRDGTTTPSKEPSAENQPQNSNPQSDTTNNTVISPPPQRTKQETSREKPTITEKQQQGADNRSSVPAAPATNNAPAKTGEKQSTINEKEVNAEKQPEKQPAAKDPAPAPAIPQQPQQGTGQQQLQTAPEPVPPPANVSPTPKITRKPTISPAPAQQPESSIPQNNAQQSLTGENASQAVDKKAPASATTQSAPVQPVVERQLEESGNIAEKQHAAETTSATRQETNNAQENSDVARVIPESKTRSENSIQPVSPSKTVEQQPTKQIQQQTQNAAEAMPYPAIASSVPQITKSSTKSPTKSTESSFSPQTAGQQTSATAQSAPMQPVAEKQIGESTANMAVKQPAAASTPATPQKMPQIQPASVAANENVTSESRKSFSQSRTSANRAPSPAPTTRATPANANHENIARTLPTPQPIAQQPVAQLQQQAQSATEATQAPARAGSIPKITKKSQVQNQSAQTQPEKTQTAQKQTPASIKEANDEMNKSAVKKSAECAFARSSAKISPRAAIKAEECDLECADKLNKATSGFLPAACPEAVYK